MEEAPFLMAMQRIIRGIQIQNDLARRFFAMGLDEKVHESFLNGCRASIRSDGAARKIRFNTARFHSGKIEPF